MLEYIRLAMQSNSYQISCNLCCNFFFVYTGSDFQLDPDRNLATVTNNASDHGRCFRIIITEDSGHETTEKFSISFTVSSVQPEGVNVNTSNEAAVFIQDDDGKSLYWARFCEITTRAHTRTLRA